MNGQECSGWPSDDRRFDRLWDAVQAQGAPGFDRCLGRRLGRIAACNGPAEALDQFGDDFEDGTSRIPVALARKDLADLISTSVETVIRVMTRWEREGVVTIDDDGFTLRNRGALTTAAGQDTDLAAGGSSFRRGTI